MDFSRIISAARAFLPAGSPLIEKMDLAQKMAGGFSPSPDGVRQLMQRMGKTQDDLRNAIAMLDNPMVSGMLNRIAPGVVDNMREAGRQLTGDATSGMASGSAPSFSASGGQAAPDPLAALRGRLSRL